MNWAPLLMATSGTGPQTETSPEMNQLIRNSLRRLVTIRCVRSFMGWHWISEFDSVLSSDDNPFAGS